MKLWIKVLFWALICFVNLMFIDILEAKGALFILFAQLYFYTFFYYVYEIKFTKDKGE